MSSVNSNLQEPVGVLGRPGWLTLLRVAAGLVVGLWILVLTAWLILHWGILPRIDSFRPQIEQRLSQALGVPLRIGAITVRSSGWVPSVSLRDVVVADAVGREALRLPAVHAAISGRSLLALELRFEQLLIEDAVLDVRRDAQGRIFVAGIEVVRRDKRSDNAAADWLFRQHEIVIRGTRVHWQDDTLARPALDLDDVQLVLRNGLRRHELRLDATPPPEWGQRFTVQGSFTQPLFAAPADWTRWSGTLFADLPAVDVQRLRRHAALPFELNDGRGALRAWLDVNDGQASGLTLDVALADVDLTLGGGAQPLRIAQASGRVLATRDGQSISLATRQFGFVTGDGLRWPAGTITLTLQQTQDLNHLALADAPVTGGELSADRIDLSVAAQIATRLPLGTALRTLLADTAPQGQARQVQARWDGPLDKPASYRIAMRLEGASIVAAASPRPGAVGRPGWRNASVDLTATEQGGSAQLAIVDGALDLPGVFEEPVVPLTDFAASLRWRLQPGATGQPPGIELRVEDARFRNADVTGELKALWHTGDSGNAGKLGNSGASRPAEPGRNAYLPGVLEMTGLVRQGLATRVARYLPLGLPRETRDYVRDAVLAGTLHDVEFRVRGDLWDFPFHNARDGDFHIAGRVENATLLAVPEPVANGGADTALATPAAVPTTWPTFTELNGELQFDRGSMAIRNARARVFGLALNQVQGGIAELNQRPVLDIHGRAQGPLSDGLRLVKTSPIGGWIDHQLDNATSAGNVDLTLALSLPLHGAGVATVKGSVALNGNDIRLRADTPVLAGARGRIDFTERGFAVTDGRARLLGGEVSFDGGSQAGSTTRINLKGTASAEGLRSAHEMPMLAQLAASLQGQTPYTLQLGGGPAGLELNFATAWQGMAIDLPEPLRKAADASLPTRVQITPVSDANAERTQAARDTLHMEIGPSIQATWLRDVSGTSPQVLRGAIAVHDPLPELKPGVQANVNLDRLDADAWFAVVKALRGTGPAASADEAAGRAADGAYLPTVVNLRARELIASARRITNVSAELKHAEPAAGDVWSARVRADQLEGRIEHHTPRAGGGTARLVADLDRLSLPAAEASTVTTLLDQPAADPPALDLVIRNFELRDKPLGRLELQAASRINNESSPAVREWTISRFGITLPEARLTATGRWAPPAVGAPNRMLMDFRLDLDDSGALLERLGMGRVLRGGKGRLEGKVSWAGSPLVLDNPSLGGQMQLSLDAGQFLNAELGGARLLGVLSLQSIPRRLTLDFRDLFAQGFAFDNVTGAVTIDRGVARTNNLRMRGASAAVLMEGSADVVRETQDLRVIVVPQIDAGTAALAYAVINPAIGLGAFVAQTLLRKPLMQANTREFHVSGSWDDPQVVRVERKPGEAMPDFDTPASEASSAVPAAR